MAILIKISHSKPVLFEMISNAVGYLIIIVA